MGLVTESREQEATQMDAPPDYFIPAGRRAVVLVWSEDGATVHTVPLGVDAFTAHIQLVKAAARLIEQIEDPSTPPAGPTP